MVIDNQPTPVAISVDEAEARRATNGVTGSVKSRANKGVGSCVDGDVTIDPNSLLTKDALVIRWRGAQKVEVITNANRVVTKLGDLVPHSTAPGS